MSTLSGRLSDAIDALRNASALNSGTDCEAAITELIDAADDMIEASPIEKIMDALRDENGLPPTAGMADVLVAVVFAMTRADEKWSEREFPGAPSTTDYAASVVKFLELRYPIKGAML